MIRKISSPACEENLAFKFKKNGQKINNNNLKATIIDYERHLGGCHQYLYLYFSSPFFFHF